MRRLLRSITLRGNYSGALEDFSSEDLGTLVAVAASSVTEIRIAFNLALSLCLPSRLSSLSSFFYRVVSFDFTRAREVGTSDWFRG